MWQSGIHCFIRKDPGMSDLFCTDRLAFNLLRRFVAFCAFIAALAAPSLVGAQNVSVQIHPRQIRNVIDRKIYSQFLEHIYHSADNGVWGQLIWNRSFEQAMGKGNGDWVRRGREIRQTGTSADIVKTFGNPDWSHYEITLDARKLSGNEGFLILFYVRNATHFCWLNIGGWGNTQDAIQQARGQHNPLALVMHPTIHVNKDHWYHARLRCDGRHIQAWVDGTKCFDYRLKGSSGLDGKIGVGTWQTQAAFKNITVRSLKNRAVLYHGLPTVPIVKHIALNVRFWSRYGTGKVRISTTDPRNGYKCVKIVTAGTEAGVEQPAVCLNDAGRYQGSVWVRGAAPDGMVVRLITGRKIIGEKSLAAPPKAWQKVHFNFTTPRPVHDATLQIGVKGSGVAYVDQASLMSEAALKIGGYRPAILAAVKALKPALIRWPGGGYADGYQWKQAIGPRADRMFHAAWDDKDPNDFGTDEYIQFCRDTGATPEICVDAGPANANARVLGHYIRQACQWLEYCNSPVSNRWGALRAKYGHAKPYGVKYWEFGNEVWYYHYKPALYARALAKFAKAMKKIDPSIRIIACGSGGLDLKWNKEIVDAGGRFFNYLDIHQYVWPPAYLQGARTYLNFIRKTGRIIKASPNPKIKLFVGEWNEQTIDWRTGIFAGMMLTGFERQGNIVSMASPALFLRWVGIPARDWNNAFINFSRSSWFPAPNYVVEKLWRDHYAKYRVACTKVPGLEADATVSANHQSACYKVVNLTDHSVHMVLHMGKTFPLGKVSALTVAPGSQFVANSMKHPNRVAPRALAVAVAGQTITIPLAKYSATVVTMQRGTK